ncbi:MAG: SpoIIIAH-like family protein [Bacillota bacterium]|jgi:stage III sporulation protein AH
MKKSGKSSAKKWVFVLCIACLAFLVYDVSQKGVLDELGGNPDTLEVVGQEGSVDERTAGNDITANKNSADNFYDDYRIEREKVRGESLELLQSIIDNPNSDTETKKSAQEAEIVIAKNMEQELLIETLLAAKNFPDAAVFIQEDKVTVVLDAQVDEKSSGKIAELVDGVTGIGFENVVIITREK